MVPMHPVANDSSPAGREVSRPATGSTGRRGGAGGEETGKARVAAVREQAHRFEASFLQTLVKQLRQDGMSEGFFGGGLSGDVYGWMFDQHLAEVLSGQLSLGLAEQMVHQMGRNEDVGQESINSLPTEVYLAGAGIGPEGPEAKESPPAADKRHEQGVDTP
ncbi:MAG: rod-binding protein [Acidobacteriota bacterium]